MSKEIRWRQRFQNFNKAYIRLNEALSSDLSSMTDLEKEGLIQRFEYTFELAGKTLKDFLESKGVIAKFPRDVIKEAVAGQIIENGEIWMDMLDKRNLLAHTDDEENFQTSVELIKGQYASCLEQVWQKLRTST